MGRNMHEVIKLLFWALHSTTLIFFTIFTKYWAKNNASVEQVLVCICVFAMGNYSGRWKGEKLKYTLPQ
jgi:hypothetical protein